MYSLSLSSVFYPPPPCVSLWVAWGVDAHTWITVLTTSLGCSLQDAASVASLQLEHVCICTCMCVKSEREGTVCVCAVRLFPLWVAAWTFPEGWCPARLTSEQPGWLGGPQKEKKKAPRGYEYKLSCWTSSDFTMAPPEPLTQTHKPKREQRGRESAMLCFGNTNVFGQLSQRTTPVIHKSERKERWIAGSKDSAEEKKKSRSRDARGRLNFWRMTHILQASWSTDKISQNNEMITCNK